MYIINPEKISNKVKCNKIAAKYFLDRNIPLLSKQGNTYYFVNTELFKEVLESAPFWVKLLMRNNIVSITHH